MESWNLSIGWYVDFLLASYSVTKPFPASCHVHARSRLGALWGRTHWYLKRQRICSGIVHFLREAVISCLIPFSAKHCYQFGLGTEVTQNLEVGPRVEIKCWFVSTCHSPVGGTKLYCFSLILFFLLAKWIDGHHRISMYFSFLYSVPVGLELGHSRIFGHLGCYSLNLTLRWGLRVGWGLWVCGWAWLGTRQVWCIQNFIFISFWKIASWFWTIDSQVYLFLRMIIKGLLLCQLLTNFLHIAKTNEQV